jgi:hypothetical protein
MMDAGRAMDALIAEHIFEQQIVWKYDPPWPEGAPILVNEEANLERGPYTLANGFVDIGDGVSVLSSPVPQPRHFSTSIGDAWLVVEWIREHNAMGYFVYALADVYVERKLIADNERWGNALLELFKDTQAPLTICVAALKAIGYDQTSPNQG